MAQHWKKQIADAQQRNRQLDNRVHELEQALADAKAERQNAVQRMVAAEKIVDDLSEQRAKMESRQSSLSDVEVALLMHIMVLEMLPETPARRRLIDRVLDAVLGDAKEPA